ncbi:MAG TPA: alpha/beta hydrolase [Myxococcales bacterium]|nr:alpha/beta hydrolase [Myxococcales bacterium]
MIYAKAAPAGRFARSERDGLGAGIRAADFRELISQGGITQPRVWPTIPRDITARTGMLARPLIEPSHPDAVAPERSRTLESNGAMLRLHEWGDPERPPVILSHGMFDHSRGFDLLAPYLAEHYRVVAMDARGHGDSDWCDSYLWGMDVFDVVNVLRALDRPAHLIGHSKGGGQVMEAAAMAPHRVRQVVNMDGFGPPDDGFFQKPGGRDPNWMTVAERCAEFLDRRRTASLRESWRPYESLDELVKRRKQQNPLLEDPWLSYFIFHGAREDKDGWRWKCDPHTAGGNFGPFKPAWIAPGWRRMKAPLLALIGSLPDTWGPLPKDLLDGRLENVANLTRATVAGAGHFIHMQQPAAAAGLMLDFLDR